MRSESPIQSPRFGRTAAIAAALLAAVAVFQLGSVTVAFFKKSRQAKTEDGEEAAHIPPMKIDVRKLIADAPPPEDPAPLANVDPLASGNAEPAAIAPPAAPVRPADRSCRLSCDEAPPESSCGHLVQLRFCWRSSVWGERL